MDAPLLTDSEAHARALQLLALFDRHPDALSPDEQALTMTIRELQREKNRLESQIAEVAARRCVP